MPKGKEELHSIGPQSVEEMLQMEEAAKQRGVEYLGYTDDQRGTRGTGFIKATSREAALKKAQELRDDAQT